MKTVARAILCWPLFLGTLISLLVHALWGSGMYWDGLVLVTELSPKSWPMKTWYRGWGGTTFGYGMMLAPRVLAPKMPDSVLSHELVHVEQLEAAAISGLMTGLLVLTLTRSWWGLAALFLCWISAGPLAYIAASVTAWLRAEPNAYSGNHMEEAAYNATEVKCRG